MSDVNSMICDWCMCYQCLVVKSKKNTPCKQEVTSVCHEGVTFDNLDGQIWDVESRINSG